MNIQNTIIAVAVAILIGIGIGWKWRDYQAKADALTAANSALASVKEELVKHDAIAADDAAKARTLEEVLAAVRINPQVVIKREKMYVEKPVYRDCVVPPDGVQLLNERVTNRHPAATAGKREGAVH